MNGKPMQALESGRDPYFDNMKAILIFLVVLGHCVSSFNEPGGFWYDWIYRVIFSFHMPAFLFVSGYFASVNPKKTIAKLLPLYLVFQVVHIFLRYLEDWSVSPEEAVLEFQLFDPQWTLWYLMVLMIYALVLPLFDTAEEKKQIRNLVLAFACGLLIGLNDEMHNFMDVSRAISFLPFFLLGYYGKKNKFFADRTAGPVFRLTALGAAAALMICFAMPECPFRGEMFYGTMSYRADEFTVGLKIGTYLISLVWILILLILTPARRIPLIGKIGRNTLGVYLFHTVAIRILRANSPAAGVLNQSLFLAVFLSVGLTLLFSMDCFSGMLRKIQHIHVVHIGNPKKTARESLPEKGRMFPVEERGGRTAENMAGK